ncbi:putative aspartyl protease [Rhizomicrobium palustre]|uniref:Putative aspartyl protease n=1 Tax=Rhizomicrobium palustre TaxID=189966 RepID=A0A846N4U1_9PROT|nr:retroviral-like aspartic protease family protein [Rhizomicrobium palustre]NIK90050.1 putative aspartyl protease [Rhizomicrobium palustre]
MKLSAVVFWGAALCFSAAEAEDCKPLKMLASIPLKTNDDLTRLYVPVEIAGKPTHMILDTGASSTVITKKIADDDGLLLTDAPIKLYGLTGRYTDKKATAPLKLGRIAFDNVQFMVDPQEWDSADVAGLLGANVLSLFDVSIDPANKKLDILSQEHCPHNVIYWPAAGYSEIPIERMDGHALTIEVKLDGKPILAQIDTGAPNSTIFINTAVKNYGVKPGDAETPKHGILNGDENLTTYSHTFKTLDFDGVAVNNPQLRLIPDKISEPLTYIPTGSRIGQKLDGAKPEMLIGMNILRHMHLYIAYKENAIYFTPASPPPAK